MVYHDYRSHLLTILDFGLVVRVVNENNRHRISAWHETLLIRTGYWKLEGRTFRSNFNFGEWNILRPCHLIIFSNQVVSLLHLHHCVLCWSTWQNFRLTWDTFNEDWKLASSSLCAFLIHWLWSRLILLSRSLSLRWKSPSLWFDIQSWEKCRYSVTVFIAYLNPFTIEEKLNSQSELFIYFIIW